MFSGQRYEVNGLPSMVTSTRRCAWSAVTLTPAPASFARAGAALPSPTIAITPNINHLYRDLPSCLYMNLASREHLLRLVVEGYLLAGLDGGDVHAQRDGVAVAGFDVGVGRLARADALHPVAHVGRGLVVDVSAGAGLHRCRLLH